jgi:hypothetical protein
MTLVLTTCIAREATDAPSLPLALLPEAAQMGVCIMSRTLYYGTHKEPRPSSRIDKFVVRRRTDQGFEAARAAADYASQVAFEVSPRLTLKPTVTYKRTNREGTKVGTFGKRNPMDVSPTTRQIADRRLAFLNE